MTKLILKQLIDEDFVNFREPSMLLAFPICDFKCCYEQGIDVRVCYNESISHEPNIETTAQKVIERFIQNPITKAIVIGGMEPMCSIEEVENFISVLRKDYHNDSKIVIYTGYYKNEIVKELTNLKKYGNIIVKYGRFIFNDKHHFDGVLGVELSSHNQYAEELQND